MAIHGLLEMLKPDPWELEQAPLPVQHLDLAVTGADLTDGSDCDAVVLGFLFEAAHMRCFHGGYDLIVIAGGDQLSEKLRLFGNRLAGSRRKRHASGLD